MNPLIKISSLILLSVSLPAFAAQATTTPAKSGNPISSEERAKIEEVVHNYLVQKPEVLMEAMQTLQKRQFEEAQKTVKQTEKTASQFATSLFQQKNDPITGNPNGKVTVTEFFDYQCPHCVDMAPVLKEIKKTNPDLRVVYKEFPIRGDMSVLAARAALAANKQGKYEEFNYVILTAPQPLTEKGLYELASTINGLNVDQLKKDMKDKSIDDQLNATRTLATSLKLFGTPAFFIAKTDVKKDGDVLYVPGQMSQPQLQDAINKISK
jgi:protein-disulfide isomerase